MNLGEFVIQLDNETITRLKPPPESAKKLL